MAYQLRPTIRMYMSDSDPFKRYVRAGEMAKSYGMGEEDMEAFAIAAGALYKLPRISIIHKERVEQYMKHLYKVPDTNKQVIKKYVRVGEGSIIYSIGRHRFIEMARAAGAVYKINEGTGGTVLINLETFDGYMEQFRQEPVPLKTPPYGAEKEGDKA